MKIRRVVLSQVAGLVVIATVLFVLVRYFNLVGWIESAQQHLAAMGPRGALLYPLFYAVCNVLLLPAGILSVGSGLFFGLWWGTLIALLGNVLGAAIAFGISRTIGRRWIERRLFRNPRWVLLDKAIAREGWKIILLSQIHPLFPTSLIDYLYGVTRIRFWNCMFWVAVGQAPGLFFYAYIGTLAQLGIKLFHRADQPGPLEYVVWFGGLALTFVATAALGRLALRLMRESEAAAALEQPPALAPAVADEAMR